MPNQPQKPGTTHAEWERCLLAVHGATETDEFLESVFRLLQATVACDFALANLRNFGGLPLVARDSLGREFGPDYMERFFKLNPSVRYVLVRPGIKLLHTKEHLPPEDELRRLPFYHEFMKPENWRHSVALLFWGFFPPMPSNAFCVFRDETQPDFSPEEVARLRALHPHISTALKRLRKQVGASVAKDSIAALLDTLSMNAVLMDWDLRITHQSATARRLCALWEGKRNESLSKVLRLPPAVLAACEQMKAEWIEIHRTNPRTKILGKRVLAHPAVAGLSAEVTVILPNASILAHPRIVVRFVEKSDYNATSPELAALTAAEREAALLVCEGCSNEDIARRLGISIAAVKLRLHQVFGKLGVQSRVQLAAKLR